MKKKIIYSILIFLLIILLASLILVGIFYFQKNNNKGGNMNDVIWHGHATIQINELNQENLKLRIWKQGRKLLASFSY